MITLKLFCRNVLFRKFIHTSTALSCKHIQQNLFINYQTEPPKCTRKVSVIGSGGYVGTACAYSIMLSDICDEVFMIDIPQTKNNLTSSAIDVGQVSSLYNGPKVHMSTDLKDTNNSDVIIITSGLSLKPNQTRLDLLKDNIKIFKELIKPVASLSPNCVFIIVSNPCDVLAYACWKFSGFDRFKCIGSGTLLESVRFRYYLAHRLGISEKSVDAYILGEHGQSCVPVWHSASISGTRLREIDPNIAEACDNNHWNDIYKEVVECAPRINKFKQCTSWGISLITTEICRAVLTDSDEVLPVSVCLQGYHDIESDSFASYPVVLGNRGVKKICNIGLTCTEIEKLKKSIEVLDKTIKTITF